MKIITFAICLLSVALINFIVGRVIKGKKFDGADWEFFWFTTAAWELVFVILPFCLSSGSN